MTDSAARDRAAHGYAENLVVVAGAGSGKTSLLVERLVCQMVECELAHDAFAAITFTEKAAAEIRRRLEAALVRLAEHARADTAAQQLDLGKEADRAFAWLRERVGLPQIAERARRGVHGLAEIEVTTIHGFCARLLRRHPIESGVGPELSIDTGERVDELVDELWERFLAGPDGVDGAQRERFARVLERLGLGELESLARAAAAFTVREDALDAPLPELAAVFGDWARASLARIERVLRPPIAPGPESWLDEARRPLEALLQSGEAFQPALVAATYAGSRGIRGLFEGSAPTSKKAPEAEALVKELRPTLDKLRQVDDALLGEALALVRPFARQVQREAKRSGLLPFDALLALARDLLLTHPRVRAEVAERYRVLFLDEFQDTDPLQYEIVFLVAAERGAALPPGRLFIVGDPKQAIYRFRGADISAYESAVTRILGDGGARLVLTANFRSRPELVQPLDRLFQHSFEPPPGADAEAPGAYVTYDGLEARREPAREPRVERWTIGAEAASAGDSRELEAEVIAGWIAGEATAGRFQPGQVALLLRALSDAHVYVRALQQRGIAVWVGRAEEPDREPASQQVTALLRALANPADGPAVIGFLRSPLGGVPDAELAAHATRNGGRWLFTSARPDPGSVPNLARAFAFLREWHARVRSEPLDRVLAALADETPLLALHAGARDGVRRLADLSALLERLTARAAGAPDRDLVRLVTSLAREEQRRASEEPVPDSNAVRVLSIHGAKGLEFDVVVLPDLARKTPPGAGDWLGIDVRFDRARGALAIRTRAALSSSWVSRQAREEIHDDAETRRLLYVAATRARERLIFAVANRTQKAAERTFGALIASFRDEALLERSFVEPAASAAAPLPRAACDSLARLERTRTASERAAAAVRPALQRPSGLAPEDEEHAAPGADRDESLPARVAAARARARAVGTALHELMERWNLKGPDTARALLRAAVTRAARLAGAPEAEVLAEAEPALEAMLASELPRALRGVEILGRELPLLFREPDGRVWSGTLDLLYRDPVDRALVVADYKTDRAPDHDSRARYRAQLAVYARGVARLFPSEPPPRLELVWLRTGQRERLPLESPA